MRRYVSVLVIWILFVIVQPIAFLAGIVAVLIGRTEYAERIMKAQNKATAAFFGFEGDEGVSRECGKRKCRLCRALCKALSWALDEDKHCEREAA